MTDAEIKRIAYAHKIIVQPIDARRYVAATMRLGTRGRYGATAIDALTALRDASKGADLDAVNAAIAEIRGGTMTNKEWLESRGFTYASGFWTRDNIRFQCANEGPAICRIHGCFDVTAIKTEAASAELAMYEAVAELGETYRRALAIWSEEA